MSVRIKAKLFTEPGRRLAHPEINTKCMGKSTKIYLKLSYINFINYYFLTKKKEKLLVWACIAILYIQSGLYETQRKGIFTCHIYNFWILKEINFPR